MFLVCYVEIMQRFKMNMNQHLEDVFQEEEEEEEVSSNV